MVAIATSIRGRVSAPSSLIATMREMVAGTEEVPNVDSIEDGQSDNKIVSTIGV